MTRRATPFFSLPEQTAVFADPDSPRGNDRWILQSSRPFTTMSRSLRRVLGLDEAYLGEGITIAFFAERSRFFRPGYQANISENWIPALDGVQQKLGTGTRVADIGCGYGASTLIMAKAFPKSEFYGFDLHPASIEAANHHAQEQHIPNVRFSIATAKDFPGQRLRICDGIRCPSRHGRSGWCSVTCQTVPSTRWHIHDCRAFCGRLAH